MPEHSNIPKDGEELPKKKKVSAGRTIFWIFLFLFLSVLIGAGLFICKYPSIAKAFGNFISPDVNQISSNSGKVNILLMGKSGADHDGADLTDTMILVSLSLNSQGGIKTVSIPRDIWVPDIMAKINSAYYWGKNGSAYFSLEETGGGISFAKKIVGEITGQEIQYGAVVDFSAFKDIIDALSGVTVNVENGFTDKLYPIEGRENDLCNGDQTYACRYETVVFNAGVQTMDGTTALKFVRSRHAEGDEGTDIAREARQQKIMQAIKEKMLQPGTYLSVKNDLALFSIAEKYIETDINLSAAGVLARLAFESSNSISQNSIPEDLLEVPATSSTYDNLYVFIPKAGNGNWSEIQDWFASTLD